MTRDPRRSAAGFTLVEVLVSLALMGMAATLLLQGLQMAGVLAQRVRGEGAGLDEMVTAQRIVRGRIERLRSVTVANSALAIVDARGTPADFSFVAPALDRSGPEALQRFRLLVTATGDLVLFTASTRNLDIDGNVRDATGWTPMVLLRGVAGITIGYFGADKLGGGQRWQTDWIDHPQPPALIRVRLTFPPGDRRAWPDLIVQPRATVNTACKIDLATGRCGGEAP